MKALLIKLPAVACRQIRYFISWTLNPAHLKLSIGKVPNEIHYKLKIKVILPENFFYTRV